MLQIGDPEVISRAYNEINFGRLVHEDTRDRSLRRPRRRRRSLDCWFENDERERITAIHQHEPITIATEVRFHHALDDPIFALTLRNDARHTIFATSSTPSTAPTGYFEAGETADRARSDWRTTSRRARYTVVAVDRARRRRAATRSTSARTSRRSSCTPRAFTGGVIDVPHSYTIERV